MEMPNRGAKPGLRRLHSRCRIEAHRVGERPHERGERRVQPRRENVVAQRRDNSENEVFRSLLLIGWQTVEHHREGMDDFGNALVLHGLRGDNGQGLEGIE